jgi:hypothetical protein
MNTHTDTTECDTRPAALIERLAATTNTAHCAGPGCRAKLWLSETTYCVECRLDGNVNPPQNAAPAEPCEPCRLPTDEPCICDECVQLPCDCAECGGPCALDIGLPGVDY